MTAKKKNKLTRRAFIVTGSILGGGLVVGLGGLTYVNRKIKQYTGQGFDGTMMNAWISILPDNTIQIAVPRAEMGQGVYTSVPMLIAEELEVEMDRIEVIPPQPESPYANTAIMTQSPRDISKGMSLMEKVAAFLPIVATGGSTTIQDGYDYLRATGATARQMLITAAANNWEVPADECKAMSGTVYHEKSGRQMSFGELAEKASEIKIYRIPDLKSQDDFRIIGTPVARLDVPEKVTGEATFGLDVRPENLLFAVVRHPSRISGLITGIQNRSEVESMPGVQYILEISSGIAVIADNTWRAKNAGLALELDEDQGEIPNLSSASISQLLEEILDQEPIASPEDIGDVDLILNDDYILESTYEVPYLAHATMEPMNCTVQVNDDSAVVWVGHQSSSMVRDAVQEVTGISKKNITVHSTYLGGGFGRRAEKDMVLSAAEIANSVRGIPIQLVYTREEDMKNDMYRPAVKSRFRAKVSEEGSIEGWDNKIALQSVINSTMKRIMPSMAEDPKNDITSIEGAAHLPYTMTNRRVSIGNLDLPIQVGIWRSVGSSQNAFFTECFMDECAHAAGMDPFEFRRNKLDAHPRFKAVLERVAELSNWGENPGQDRYRGIALHKSFNSIVGQVAEITRLGEKEFAIDRFYCAIDCGKYVNPNTIEAQMEGGIVFGLSAAIFGKITIDNGQIQQENFPQYDMVRLGISPVVDVSILDVDAYPGGVGEPGTPPAAPALVNALFAATGERIRSLPLVDHGLSFV